MTVIVDTGTDKLLIDVQDGIALLTFNNPEKHNALSAEIRTVIPTTLQALDANDDVRVLVMTGAGGKAFVSGADISEFEEHRTSPEARATYDRLTSDITEAWDSFSKPIIAMIRGFCIGGGLLTALAADIRIASDDSQFGIPAARLGLGYGFDPTKNLVRLVGPASAAEILFSARRLGADEAREIGLVNRVVSRDRLEEEVMELARSISTNAPLTIAAAKAALRELRRDPENHDLSKVAQLVEACFQSEDFREGQRAFLEKRPPRFNGR